MDAILLIIAVFIAGIVIGHENAYEGKFVKHYRDKPYCIEDKAEVLEKTVEIKRCWKAVEVPP